MKKQLSLLLSLLLIALVAVGCGGTDKKPAAEEKKPTTAKVLKIGTNPDFAPFEFQDDKTKDYVGFDMELIKAMAKKAGYEAQINSLAFDGILPALMAGNIDVAISGITITPERSEKVLFTTPYYKSGLSIIVKLDNKNINSIKDLEGKKIAVQIGTSSAMAAKKIPNAIVREFNTTSDVYMEVKNGGADAGINDLPVNQYYIKTTGSKDLKMVGDLLAAEDYGIAVNKKSTDLQKQLNAALEDLKKSGEYDKIYEKWFGKVVK